MGMLSFLTAAVLLPGLAGDPSQKESDWSDLLAPGTRKCEVLDLQPSARLAPLMERFLAAGRANPDWFVAHAANSPPGPLPWHPNLGFTRDEWSEYLRLLDSDIHLVTIGAGSLQIGSRGRGQYVFLGEFEDLHEVTLNLSEQRVTTPLGNCTGFRPIEPRPGQKFGQWRGFTCSHTEGDPRKYDAVEVSFSVGRLVESDMLFLGYKLRQIMPNKTVYKATVQLRCARGPNESIVRPGAR